MLQTHPQPLVQKMNKFRHKAKGGDSFFYQSGRLAQGSRIGTVSKLLSIRQKRKMQILEEKEVDYTVGKRKSVNQFHFKERFQPLSVSVEKNFFSKNIKRHTYHFNSLRQSDNLSKLHGNTGIIPRTRIKRSFNYGQTIDNNDVNTISLGFQSRLESRRKIKRQIDWSLSAVKMEKKLCNTMEEFKMESQQEPLVHLIDKFNFGNLKTAPCAPQSSNSPNFDSDLLEAQMKNSLFFQDVKDRQKMNKTMMKIEMNDEGVSSRYISKISALSPWQQDSKDMGSTTDII